MGIFAQRLKDTNSFLDNIGWEIKISPLKVAKPDISRIMFHDF